MSVLATGTVVWSVGDPKPRVWSTLDTRNPVIYVAWSYWTWGKKIVKTYQRA